MGLMACVLMMQVLVAETPPPPVTDTVLVAAAREYTGVRFHTGSRDPLLTRLASEYAGEMARSDSQSIWREGHFGFESRYARIRAELDMRAVEVSAESWRWQSNAPMPEIGRTMFDSWKASAGHWGIISTPHARYGDGLARSRRGVWYSAIIVAD